MKYIPGNYYIIIRDGQGGHNYTTDNGGWCYIGVYKSLRGENERPLVEHALHLGNFSVEGKENMTADEFLRKIREGIERIIASETKLPIN